VHRAAERQPGHPAAVAGLRGGGAHDLQHGVIDAPWVLNGLTGRRLVERIAGGMVAQHPARPVERHRLRAGRPDVDADHRELGVRPF
jgi:hypothetical protein